MSVSQKIQERLNQVSKQDTSQQTQNVMYRSVKVPNVYSVMKQASGIANYKKYGYRHSRDIERESPIFTLWKTTYH